MAKARYRTLHVASGDVVMIDADHYPVSSNMRDFQAIVEKVEERLWTRPLITYRRVDGFKGKFPPMCDAVFVKSIVQRAPYVVKPRERMNIFSLHGRYSFISKKGGLRTGPFLYLVCNSLARISNLDLKYPLHEERAEAFYRRHSSPGKIPYVIDEDALPGMITVRTKTFDAWVKRNASRLIMTRAEAVADARKIREEMDNDLMDALGADMDVLEAEMDLYAIDDMDPSFGEDPYGGDPYDDIYGPYDPVYR